MKQYFFLIFSLLILASFLVFFKPFSSQAQTTTSSCPDYQCVEPILGGQGSCCPNGYGVIREYSAGNGYASRCSNDAQTLACAAQGQVYQSDQNGFYACRSFSTNACDSIASSPSLPSPVPSPSTDNPQNIRIYGEIGNCLSNYAQAYDNAKMVVWISGNPNQINLSSDKAYYNPSTKKTTYDLTILRQNVNAFEIQIAATKDGFTPRPVNIKIQPDQKEIIQNINLRANRVLLRGRIYDQEQLSPIPDTWFRLSTYYSNDTKVPSDGEYEMAVARKKGDFELIYSNTSFDRFSYGSLDFNKSYGDKIGLKAYSDNLDACPIFEINVGLSKKPDCQIINSVKFCWFGTEAKSLHNEAANQIYWQDWANRIITMRNRTGFQSIPEQINIVDQARNGWVFNSENKIYIGAPYIIKSGWRTDDILVHEFGHLFEHAKPSIKLSWEKLYQYNRRFLNSWTAVSETWFATLRGHPQDNYRELFASTFSIMERYNEDFKTTINNTADANLKDWLKKVYNAQAPNFRNPSIPLL